MIQLRDYQEQARTDLRNALRQHRSVLMVLPTGAGKTVLASALIQILFNADKRVIFAVHRRELLKQTAKTFEQFGIPFSYVAAGKPFNPLHRVWIASIASLKNRLGNVPADFVFIDEAHLSAAAGWNAVVSHYRETGARIIGLTATPERLDGKPLRDNFDLLVPGPTPRQMIERGNLSTYRAYAPAGIDLTGVHTRGGDFVTAEIDAIMEGKAVLAGAVHHWQKFAPGLRTIAFTPSVARAEDLAREFEDNGISAVAIHGNTPIEQRNRDFLRFADGGVKVITSVNLFSEGFDLAAQVGRDITVEAVLLYRPTKSVAMHLQQVGRALRKKPYPAVILDLVGNIARLGLPDDDFDWSLDGRKKTKRTVAVTDCPSCGGAHHPAPKCPYCGHQYTVETTGGRVIEEVDGEIEEIDVAQVRRQRLMEQAMCGSREELVELARARGYKNPAFWAKNIWDARQKRRA
ncbi:helicase [Paracoccus phage vB_PmaP_KLEP18-1]|nr:helicase [Paracoccus phage vB_PmaP_KLEP18-1]